MLGIYFSGTGNSKYAIEVFLREYDNDLAMFSIEDKNLIEHINNHSKIWKDKKVFIIATMALFSGDGAGVV